MTMNKNKNKFIVLYVINKFIFDHRFFSVCFKRLLNTRVEIVWTFQKIIWNCRWNIFYKFLNFVVPMFAFFFFDSSIILTDISTFWWNEYSCSVFKWFQRIIFFSSRNSSFFNQMIHFHFEKAVLLMTQKINLTNISQWSSNTFRHLFLLPPKRFSLKMDFSCWLKVILLFYLFLFEQSFLLNVNDENLKFFFWNLNMWIFLFLKRL